MYSIRLDGDIRRLASRLHQLEEVDLRGVSLALAESLRTSTRERFKETKSPEDKLWETSIRATREGGTTLTDTAGLKNSIKSTVDGSGFAIGTNKIYARTHQFGDEARKIRRNQATVTIKIPARPFLGISEDDMNEIRGTLEDALAGD